MIKSLTGFLFCLHIGVFSFAFLFVPHLGNDFVVVLLYFWTMQVSAFVVTILMFIWKTLFLMSSKVSLTIVTMVFPSVVGVVLLAVLDGKALLLVFRRQLELVWIWWVVLIVDARSVFGHTWSGMMSHVVRFEDACSVFRTHMVRYNCTRA